MKAVMFYRDKSVKQSENNNYLKINHNYYKRAVSVKLDTNWISVVYFLPVFVAFISYVNGLTGDFVHDDVFAIKKNADVLGKSDLVNVFYNDYWGLPVHRNESHKSYRPLTVITFRLNHWLFGLNSCSFHVVNVCLHVIVTTLLVYTCRHVIGLGEKCSCIAGLLFAVHPIHVEAVTGIVGRADILAAVFYLLSFITYFWCIDAKKDQTFHVYFVSSMLLSGIAMLCKETGVTAIGLCVIYDVIKLFNQKRKQKTVSKKSLITRILLAACWTVVILSLRIKIMGRHLPRFTNSANPASFSDSVATRWMTYGYLWSYNFWMMLMPYKLCYDWQHASIPLVEHVTDLRNLATILCITILVYIVLQTFIEWRNIQRKTEEPRPFNYLMLISVAMTAIPFLPASNLLFPVGFVLAERVLYIPSMGFCICVAVGICKLQERLPVYKHHILSVTCFVLMMLTVKTWKQNMTWESRETLFRSGIQVMPHNAKVHFNYANFLKSCDKREEAIHHYKTAISLDDHYPSAHNNLATLLTDDVEIEKHLRRTIKLQPNHQRAHMNLGSLLFNQGQRRLGASYLYKAVDIDNTNPEVLTTLAHYLIEVGNITEAENYLRQAEDIAPDYSDIYTLYGSIYTKLGRHSEAAKYYKKAYQLDTSQTVTLVHAAHAHQYQGDFIEAEKLLKQAIDIKPNINTFKHLAVLYYNAGRRTDSLEVYDQIERMGDNSTDTQHRYAKLLASEGDLDRAEMILSRVMLHNDSHIEYLKTFAQVKSKLRKYTEALDILTRAIHIGESAGNDTALERLYLDRGNNYKDLERYREALADYESVLKYNPLHVMAHGNCGAIYHLNVYLGTSLGNVEKAKYHYETANELEPGSTIIQENLVKLERLLRERGLGVS